MKHIKDVDGLKDLYWCFVCKTLVSKDHRDEQWCDVHRIPAEAVKQIIDSLAVEVPEAKPGAIAEILAAVENNWPKNVNVARAELAQLQADQDRALNNERQMIKDLDIARKLVCDLHDENTNLKGALRTLAKKIPWRENACIIGDYVSCEDVISKFIAYALANPTEEVEG